MRFHKCEFCKNWDLRNVIFFNGIFKVLPNFWIKSASVHLAKTALGVEKPVQLFPM